jgi:hypothetical protein
LVEAASQLNQDAQLPKPKAKTQVTANWPRYAQLRASQLRPTTRRPGLKGLDEVSPQDEVHNSLIAISKLIRRFSTKFTTTGMLLRASSGQIDFARDFTEFVRNANLRFMDIPPVRFDRFKFTSRYAVPDIVNLQRFTMPYLPIGVARILEDFEGQSPDELSVRKGQVVYLMQKPDEGWIFVMRKPYGVCGFVPESFAEVIGVGTAVLLAEVRADRFDDRVGAVLAVIKEGEGGAVLVEDERAVRAECARQNLAIL